MGHHSPDRLGFLLTPSTLAYATDSRGSTMMRRGCPRNCLVTLTPKAVSDSPTKAGLMVGGGPRDRAVGQMAGACRISLCRLRNFVIHGGALGNGSNVPAFASVDNVEVRLPTHTATFGLAYKFGDPVVSDQAAAFAYDATSAASWSGLYAGLGLGARVSQSETTTTSAIFLHAI